MRTEPGLTALRVLCLEDEPCDAELLLEQLVKSGFDVEMRVAVNREEFSALLVEWEYDIILADFMLPDFNAFGALDAAAAAGIDVPFICVSGTIGEEDAVELLRRGASDYVLKDRMGRLPFAVRRALQSAREEREIRILQERFSQLFEHMPDAVIVHGESVTLANPAAQRAFGYSQSASMQGVACADLVRPESLQEAHSWMDQLRNGAESVGPNELQVVRADGSSWFAEATMSMIASREGAVFVSTLRDLTQRRLREGQLAGYRTQLEELTDELRRSLEVTRGALMSVTAVISRTVEIRDPYTAGHQRRVTDLALAVATRMGMAGEEVEELAMAAAIHDVGKVAIPAEILSKPARLTAAEFEIVKGHSAAGCDIIASAQLTGNIPVIVYQHHERCDGSGYPLGLVGTQLLPASKILMVADVVEAMSSHRPYRAAMGIEAAREEIAAGSGVLFDPEVVEACMGVLDAGFVFEDIRV